MSTTSVEEQKKQESEKTKARVLAYAHQMFEKYHKISKNEPTIQILYESPSYTPDTEGATVDDLKALAASSKPENLSQQATQYIGDWEYDRFDEKCLICYSKNNSICDGCVEGASKIDDCSIIVGSCTHYMHAHCFAKTNSSDCPLCRRHWDTLETHPISSL